MTKSEKEYLKQQITHNKDVMKKVESGQMWGEIFKTEEQKLAFIQGLHYANDVFDKFING